jgi:uncharacterized protein YraI
MMKQTLFLSALLLLVLAGCNLPGTLPTCPTDGLLAPVLVTPANGGSVNSLQPTLVWAYPDPACNPEGYRIDLSTDEAFADTSLSGGTGNPSTSWSPGRNLQACETYYWRVAAINGTTLGAFSAANAFRVEISGVECPPVSPPASASIRGVVWHDLCAVPVEGETSTPAGCVVPPTGGLRANGIREAGEPGIAGVQVNLHFGACSEPVVANQITNANGEYVFDGILAFGEHCVSVDALSEINTPVLIPGGWTFPLGTADALATRSANLESGTNIEQDFGWDYQMLPAPSAPAVVATATTAPPTNTFNVTTDANCRTGPGTMYDVVTGFRTGQTLSVTGRNADSSWWVVTIPTNNQPCWISGVTGQFNGNPANIAVITPPPTPTPIPDTAVPTVTDITTSANTVYYFQGCGPNSVEISAKVTDPSGVKSVTLRYRYVGPAYFGQWRTLAPTSSANDVYKFMVNVGNEAQTDLQALNGTMEYQFIAVDNRDNSGTLPAAPLSITVNYCP